MKDNNKVCGIICEYNPFHDGHRYQIKYIRKHLKPKAIICFMSGNYVQRGEPAIIDKGTRTKDALYGGADIVIEIPPNHAINNSENFAKKAFDIINLCNCVTHLSFGCEVVDISLLKNISDMSKEFINTTKLSFNDARADFIERNLKIDKNIMYNSNLILAIEYLKFIGDIIPFPVKREGASYNDLNIEQEYPSASALRKKIAEDNSCKYLVMDDFVSEIIHVINFEKISGISLLKRLKNVLHDAVCTDEIIENASAKNISRSTIKRTLMRNILELKEDASYVHVLGFKDKYSKFLKKFDNLIYTYNEIYNYDDDILSSYLENRLADNYYNYKLRIKYKEDRDIRMNKVILK